MPVILHLTDLHFGRDSNLPSENAERQLCLDGLLTELQGLDAEWCPTAICITGDIGWRGAKSDYDKAKEWLDKVLLICKLSYGSVLVCAGNHDVIRDVAVKVGRPRNGEDADQLLSVPIADHYEKPFANFSFFCESLGIPKLRMGEYHSYLVGERMLDTIRFIVINTAWFCKDEQDKGNLWLGLPHIIYLESKKQLALADREENPVTVAIMHHPKEWLNEAEIHATRSPERVNSIDYLANRCNILLTGHTHGEVRPFDRIAGQAFHATGGAVYDNPSHFNSFSLIRINGKKVERFPFEFVPKEVRNKWQRKSIETCHLRSTTEDSVSITGVTIAEKPTIANAISPVLEFSKLFNADPGGLLPYGKNPFFTGRIRELNELKEAADAYFKLGPTEPIVLLGMGGIGKTQLISQHAKAMDNLFRPVMWANADSQESLDASMERLLGHEGFAVKLPQKMESGNKIAIFKRVLREKSGWMGVTAA